MPLIVGRNQQGERVCAASTTFATDVKAAAADCHFRTITAFHLSPHFGFPLFH